MTLTPGQYRRRILDDELDSLLKALPAIAIEGAKAVGKTATASQRARIVYQLDDPAQRAIAEADLDRLASASEPVLLDEWQYVPGVWDRVRRAVDSGAPAGRFLLTGSASPVGAGTHTGGGRIVSLRMRPLSLAERLGMATVSVADLLTGERPNVGGESRITIESYTEEILRSGFPGLRGLSGRPLRAQLDGYLQRVVDRDFPELGHAVRNPTALRRWMASYAAAAATVTSFEKIRNAATGGEDRKPAKTAVQPYRDVLERLFIIDPVPAWRPSRSHIAELALPPKHHLSDPALAARLVGATSRTLLRGESPGPPIPRDGTFLGALFESLITLSLRAYAQANGAGVRHFRTHRGDHEADLIVERDDGRVVAFEVKFGPTPDADAVRHLLWLSERLGDDLLDAVVVTTGKNAYRRLDGIAVVPAALLGP
ncbi:MAG: ATP-binding protein [Actinomycetota bacterium]